MRMSGTRRAPSDRALILLLAAIMLLSALALLLGGRARQEARIVEIVLAGEVVERIALSGVDEGGYLYPLRTELGENILLIEPDGVSIISADCPDKLCVKRGKISSGLLPLTCLPHRLTVRVVGGDTASAIDAVSGR